MRYKSLRSFLFILVAFLSTTLLLYPTDIGAQVLEQDSLALVDLYNSTGGDNWNNNSGWLSGSVSTWYGIDLDASGTRVDFIAMSYNNMVGPLPSSFWSLTELVTVSLYGNSFSGTLPPEIDNLKKVEALNLQGSQFEGSIPAEIAGLDSIKELNLSMNNLTGGILPELGSLSTLTKLDLWDNQISGSIPPELGNLTNLQNLSISDNQLSGSIPAELGNLANLQFLSLRDNQLSGSIPVELGNLANLLSLDLSNTEISGSIPSELGNLTNLWYLYLGNNQLTGPIPPELGNLTNLWDLNLTSNKITGSIPPELGNLVELRYLYLNDTQLSGSIPSELGNLVNLLRLHLSDNQLSGPVPTELCNLVNLQNLTLARNYQLSGPIPEGFSDFVNLQMLTLETNQFTSLPDLSSLTSLTFCSIYNNSFDFGDIEPLMALEVDQITYRGQDSIGIAVDTSVTAGSSLALVIETGGTANHYQWKKSGVNVGADNDTLFFESITEPDAGYYECHVTSDIVPDMTLYSHFFKVTVDPLAVDKEAALPDEYALHCAYPNPFNPATTIRYELPEAAEVALIIYDLLGREIVRLVDGLVEVGYHRVIWDCREVSSGVYIARLVTPGFTESIKMVLLK